MAQESCEIILPGPFVVLQGIQGDGMWNTIDSVPIVQDEEESDEFHHVQEHASDGVVVDYDSSLASSSGEQQQAPMQPPIHQSPLTTFDPMLASTNMPPLSLNPLTTTVASATAAVTNTSLLRRSDQDSFIVVDDQQQQNNNTQDGAEERAIEAWNVTCRLREERYRQEWLQQHHSSPIIPTNSSTGNISNHYDDWWQQEGRLVIFKEIPKKQSNGSVTFTVKQVLSPGSTLMGTTMIYLDCDTLQQEAFPQKEHPKGIPGKVQLLKVQDGGFVTFSVNGYCFLGPGLPSCYISPEHWIWRVTYLGGAFVREGLELNSKHIATLPYGSFVQVSQKTISTDGGLSRLWVNATLPHDEGETPIQGWISEYLNPTSTTGERGPIAQPVPFPVPALYRVILKDGALIRSDVELSSKQIGLAPFGSVLCIVGRAFSEHPQDKCIERLKLAGNGGWVSARLNELPPDDTVVFKFQNVDESFDPDNPGVFHLRAQAGVHHDVNPEFEGADLSSIDESTESSTSLSSAVIRCGVATDGPLRHGYSEGHCIACLSEERNATIVHGETGHIACCLVCARILKAQGKDCPVCRLPIDSVIQHFWA